MVCSRRSLASSHVGRACHPTCAADADLSGGTVTIRRSKPIPLGGRSGSYSRIWSFVAAAPRWPLTWTFQAARSSTSGRESSCSARTDGLGWAVLQSRNSPQSTPSSRRACVWLEDGAVVPVAFARAEQGALRCGVSFATPANAGAVAREVSRTQKLSRPSWTTVRSDRGLRFPRVRYARNVGNFETGHPLSTPREQAREVLQ
jgi:hypothetical protein